MAEEGGCGSDAVEREEAAAVEPEVAAKAAIRWSERSWQRLRW